MAQGAMPGGPAPAIAPEIDDQWDNDGLRYRVAVHVIAHAGRFSSAQSHRRGDACHSGRWLFSRRDRSGGYEVARWANSLGITAFASCAIAFRPIAGRPGRWWRFRTRNVRCA
jgi:hypothetical protein